MNCNNCGTEMESINKWMSDKEEFGVDSKYIVMVHGKVTSKGRMEREYDLLECPKCGECKIIRIKDGN